MGKTTRTLAILAIAAMAGPVPAAAQPTDYDAVMEAIRGCAKIADVAARAACYDAIASGEPATGPSAAPAPTPNPAPAPSPGASVTRAPGGFGGEQLPKPAAARAAEPKEISARVSAAVEREPGVYLLTLEDGAQWVFVDSAPASYDMPRRGSTIDLIGASLGSYLMRYADQRAIRVRRVR
jgi:hypothetical protein